VIGDLRGGWVGQIFCFCLGFPHRETPENVKKQIKKTVWFFLVVFVVVKTFRHDLFVKCFMWMFFNSHHCGEALENAIKEKSRGKTDTEIFVGLFGNKGPAKKRKSVIPVVGASEAKKGSGPNLSIYAFFLSWF
jgi:hypothetical protein